MLTQYSRSIAPAQLTTLRVANADADVVWFFHALMLLTDRDGRLVEDQRRIEVELLPFYATPEGVTVADLLARLAAIGLIRRYRQNGLSLIQVADWSRDQSPHGREPASILPVEEEGANGQAALFTPSTPDPDTESGLRAPLPAPPPRRRRRDTPQPVQAQRVTRESRRHGRRDAHASTMHQPCMSHASTMHAPCITHASSTPSLPPPGPPPHTPACILPSENRNGFPRISGDTTRAREAPPPLQTRTLRAASPDEPPAPEPERPQEEPGDPEVAFLERFIRPDGTVDIAAYEQALRDRPNAPPPVQALPVAVPATAAGPPHALPRAVGAAATIEPPSRPRPAPPPPPVPRGELEPLRELLWSAAPRGFAPPDDGLCRRVLEVTGHPPLDDIADVLIRLAQRRKFAEMHSYGYMPVVLASHFPRGNC